MGPLVLLVDDDDDTLEMYSLWFPTVGLRVTVALTAADGFQQAVAQQPNIVVTDLGLGAGLGGCALAEQLKGTPATRRIPVLALTGWITADVKDRALRAGCDAVLTKPCDPDELHAEIQRLLAKPPSVLL